MRKFEAMMKTDLLSLSHLQRNPFLYVRKTEAGIFIIKGYSPRDAVEVSARLYEMLDHFDGRRPVEDIIESLVGQKKLVPEPDLLLSLYHLRILIPSSGPTQPADTSASCRDI